MSRLNKLLHTRYPRRHQDVLAKYGVTVRRTVIKIGKAAALRSVLSDLEFEDISTIMTCAVMDTQLHFLTNLRKQEQPSATVSDLQNHLLRIVVHHGMFLKETGLSKLQQEQIKVTVLASLLRESYHLESVNDRNAECANTKLPSVGSMAVWGISENILLGIAIALSPSWQRFSCVFLCEIYCSIRHRANRALRFQQAMKSPGKYSYLKNMYTNLRALAAVDFMAKVSLGAMSTMSQRRTVEQEKEERSKLSAFVNEQEGMDDDSEDFAYSESEEDETQQKQKLKI